ncbi:hypothetical protein BRPE64_ACDS07170 [Caballeronia insecticola]|uniref:Uncharacterized protein n=1 Tax=Caballeronia insecticola TaxID=758793 RepID=R4WU94_9BURK|nr:hypothetical protein BRPE64_ACDS07170 [Caballeronia insecticola]
MAASRSGAFRFDSPFECPADAEAGCGCACRAGAPDDEG